MRYSLNWIVDDISIISEIYDPKIIEKEIDNKLLKLAKTLPNRKVSVIKSIHHEILWSESITKTL